MIIDIDAFLGHYPFRKLRFTTAGAMVDHMDAHGIDVAVVSSLHAVFYRDSHRGNEELLDDITPHASRLVPVAVVNPKYVGWKRDLHWSIETGRVRGIALHPEHHGYKLTDDHGQAVLEQIVAANLPVVLTQRLEDRRQRHHWDVAEDLKANELLELAKAFPTLRFALLNWLGLDGGKLLAAHLKGRCLMDFSRMHVVGNKDVPKLIPAMGVESVAFGTHMPFDYVAPSLVKLANIRELFPEQYEAMAWQNAATFFGLKIDGNNRLSTIGST